MKFINTDGMAFIGPGSEWFWTALTGLVLALTFLAIYRQLSLARSASAREQMVAWDREWDSERQMRYRHEILVALRDGADRAHLPEGAATGIAVWWDQVAQLARSGDQDLEALTSRYGGLCELWWATLAPHILRLRSEVAKPSLYVDFGWLAEHVAEMERRAAEPAFDINAPIVEGIASLEGSLRVEEALRTVIVAPPDLLRAGEPRPSAAEMKPRRRSPATP